MTLSRLIKNLQLLEMKHGGRVTVCVNKDTFWDGNQSWELCDLLHARYEYAPVALKGGVA